MVYVAQFHVNLSSQFLDKIEPRWSFEICYKFVNKITGTKPYSLVVPLWNKWTGLYRQRTVHYYTLFHLIWRPPCSSRILFHPFWRLPVPVPPVSRTRLQPVPTCSIWLYHLSFPNSFFWDSFWVFRHHSTLMISKKHSGSLKCFLQSTILLERVNNLKKKISTQRPQTTVTKHLNTSVNFDSNATADDSWAPRLIAHLRTRDAKMGWVSLMKVVDDFRSQFWTNLRPIRNFRNSICTCFFCDKESP